MTRFRTDQILWLFTAFLLFACGEEEKTQADPIQAEEEVAAQLVEEDSATEFEIEEEAGYIKEEVNSLQALPDGVAIEFQEEGFAFPISYEINYAQAIIPPGSELQFLDHESRKVHSAKTLENFLLVDELFEHKVTTTDLDTSIKPHLILLGDKVEIKWLNLKEITDSVKKQELANRINLKRDYSDEFEDTGGALKIELVAYNKEVIVHEFEYKQETYFILSYTFADYQGPAATFLLSQGAEYPLTGPCSFFSYPELFLLNERLYLQSGSRCCECGISVQQLFEFNGKELKTILEDGSWST